MKYYTLLLVLLLTACTSSSANSRVTEAPPTVTVTRIPPTATSVPQTSEERGRVWFVTMQNKAGFACATCHYTTSDTRLIGPALAQLKDRFERYSLDMELEAYIRQSILEPNHFITPADPAYPSGVMPQNYADIFSDDQIDDLVAYLISLQS